jgi:hypothetical protein
MVDRFYHTRDHFRAVNQLEDTVLVKRVPIGHSWSLRTVKGLLSTVTLELGFERIWVRVPNGQLA